MVYNFANTRLSSDSIFNSDKGVGEWIVLCRQSFGIVRIAQDVLYEGPIGQIFENGIRRADMQNQLPNDGFPGADCLRELSNHIGQTTEEPRAKDAYMHAISELLNCFAVASALPKEALELSDIFGWPFRVSDNFLESLQQSRQEAPIILAYFALITKRLESKWWLEGFGDHLMSMIYKLLDEEHIPWVKWPIEAMDWKPELPKL